MLAYERIARFAWSARCRFASCLGFFRLGSPALNFFLKLCLLFDRVELCLRFFPLFQQVRVALVGLKTIARDPRFRGRAAPGIVDQAHWNF